MPAAACSVYGGCAETLVGELMKPIRRVTVTAPVSPRITANRNSFQVLMSSRIAVAAMPGAMPPGCVIRNSVPEPRAAVDPGRAIPATRGTASKTFRSSQTTSGSRNAVLTRIRPERPCP